MSRLVWKLLAPVAWAGAVFAWLYAFVFGAVVLNGGLTVRHVLVVCACVAAGGSCVWGARRLGAGGWEPEWAPMVLPGVPAPPRWRPPVPHGPLPADPAARELYLVRCELTWLRKRVAPGWNSVFRWRFRLRILPLLRGIPLLWAVVGLGGGVWAAGELLSAGRPAQPLTAVVAWLATAAALAAGCAGAALTARDIVFGVRRTAALIERERELTHPPNGRA